MGRRAADKSAARFVKEKILLADSARRNKTVGAGFVEFDEQSGAGHPGYVAIEDRTDAVGQEMGDQPVSSFALGFHGPSFSGGGVSGDPAKPARIAAGRHAVGPELERADQRTMHDEIGIAADRRSEMRVATQIEAE